MLFPNYRFVELAMEGVNNRGNITDVRTVKNFAGRRECYLTYFRYSEEMADHFQDKGSVKGFNGSAYADWLPIDIDAEDLHEAQEMLNTLVSENFPAFDIDPNTCRFYFSGAKGFHVMIPAQLFGAQPSHDIEKRFRNVALTLSRGIKIDASIYNKTRLFRLPNTINGKTGRYKRELYHFEALNMSISEILAQAAMPVDRYEIETEFDVNEEVKEIYDAPLEQSRPQQNGPTGESKAKLCLAKLLQGVGAGERDNVGVRIAAHLKQSGLTRKQMWLVLEEWNLNNKPALETYELERILDQGLQDYSYGCHDHILKQHCSKDCVLYRKEWSRFI